MKPLYGGPEGIKEHAEYNEQLARHANADTAELTVEQALAELQFMFPESPTHQIIVARGRTAPGLTRYTAAAGALAIWSGNTLAECMAQVRAWHEQQSRKVDKEQ